MTVGFQSPLDKERVTSSMLGHHPQQQAFCAATPAALVHVARSPERP